MTTPWGQPGPQNAGPPQPGTGRPGWQPAGPPPPYGNLPTPPPGPPPVPPSGQGASSKKSRAGFLLGLAGGVVVAVVVGLVLALTGVLHFGSKGQDEAAAVDTTPVTMPDTLGGLRQASAVVGEKSPEQGAKTIERYQATAARTAEAYSAAYGGAAAGVQVYADDNLETIPTVIAVRAPSPRMTNGVVSDPADLGLAALPQQVKQFGDVDCLIVQQQTAPAGQEIDPENERTTSCQRTGDGLTVQVTGLVEPGPTGQSTMIAVTNGAYDALVAGG